ncbi:hypothetical protein F11_13085 [Rhodospirillum rubrum F11]|uniref:Transglycosylase SLT domain-containing protein n=3 Tax=Rhodospirillum rubrum TaxID=1085 RepID=Q2RR97_RHORT|nr:transglycosylase SLT domain-containing protein [Rhodospirillum rubrum]ABC23348.1 hypothetical protein Rru_A2548 [Rhodospirillum rubrum ATCC 11170]AEO49081.1 hypothetical protein F11_13085 [Rhodospirillum rubrum F11]MBK5954992.1 hypothetical protein [Rhodospirillum rubrum]QXG79321.1 transglycosylase SLT domain-containing protein [Rhodospirillum rubrum]
MRPVPSLRRALACAAGLLLAALPLAARAQTPPSALCAAQTLAQNRNAGFPEHMLTAISLVESGRWDRDLRARIAWPWTVMAEGRGRFFQTKAEALAEVRLLQAKGVANIDVGCMQVNLRYHGGAFDSLEEAIDPAANVAYAASFLRRLFDDTNDWAEAVTAYHSKTEVYAQRYAAKINEAWLEARASAQGRVQLASQAGPATGPAAGAAPSASLFSMARPYEGYYYATSAPERLAHFQAEAQRRAEESMARARAADVIYQQRRAKAQAEQAAKEEAGRSFAEGWREKKLKAWQAQRNGESPS